MGDERLAGFPPRTVDKVERLLSLLGEMDEHPLLRGKLALHGGTALNLFMLDIPRLSVDIDVSYVGALGKDEMLAERPLIERGVREAAHAQGYSISGGEGGHAGRTFVFNYRSQWGPDLVKVDCVYLNRSPVLPLVKRATPLRPSLDVLSFDDPELIGGKVKAFFDRVKVRDLYDIANLETLMSKMGEADELLAHAVVLYYASLSASFPFGFDQRPRRFEGLEDELRDQLHPMLSERDSKPDLETLVRSAEAFVESRVLPRTELEREYLSRFAQGDYNPELIFEDGNMVLAAKVSPQAQWKLSNLKRM
jgi:hypothetical protein